MPKKKYRRYSPEYKRLALKRSSEDGVTDREVCKDLGISERQLRRWRDQYRLLGEQAFPGEGKKRDDEIADLKRKLAKAEQERDFLKDAAVFFAKESK
ncbi:MAG: transposase [Woeseiaceae bacterium]|jgi:transposase